MALVRWSDAFRDLAHWQEQVNRTFGEPFGRVADGALTPRAWVPPVDIYQNGDHEVMLRAELPGLSRDEIEITVDKGVLTLKGEKKPSDELKDEQFHRIERRYGTFSRSFSLPPAVDATKVAAEYRDGVLTVRLPVREEAKPRQIKVNVAA